MPNWCHNNLVIEGEAEDILDFSARVQYPAGNPETDLAESLRQPLWFSSLVPEPSSEDTKDFDWFSWRIENWGTKWEPSFSGKPFIVLQAEGFGQGEETIPDFRMKGSTLEYNFDTAWAPPISWVVAVSKMYPNLELSITYGEPGNGYGGCEVYKNGSLVSALEGSAEEFLDSSQLWF